MHDDTQTARPQATAYQQEVDVQPMLQGIDLSAIHARMHTAAQHLCLPVRRHTWQGRTGHLLGAGTGSSIEFQDHRPYAPGDDPRQIDWRAYARTSHYVMKMHRAEVSPRVDVVLDASRSMTFDVEKWTRSLELLYFTIESAGALGSSTRCTFLDGRTAHELPIASLLAQQLPTLPAPTPQTLATNDAPELNAVHWRYGSLRIVISDLLFPGEPNAWLAVLGAAKGNGMLLVPYTQTEIDPAWSGNLHFVDCETRAQRKQRVSPELLQRYKQQYMRHFDLWRDACTRYALLLARVPSHSPFEHALQEEALRVGVVELCNS